MRQTAHGEYGKFLPADERIQPVDGRDTRLDKFVWIVTRGGIDGLAVDIHALFGNDGRAAVARVAHAVEHAPEHIFRDGEFEAVPQKLCAARGDLQPLRIFEELDERPVALDFEHLAAADPAVLLHDLDEFVVLDPFHALDEHERPDNFFDGLIFLKHGFPLRPARGSRV